MFKAINRFLVFFLTVSSLTLLNMHAAQAATAMPYYDLLSWQSVVSGEEVFETIAANVALADEVTSIPGNSTVLGSPLTYQAGIQLEDNTILTKGFQLSTGDAAGNGFIFNHGIDLGWSNDWLNALSIDDATSPNDDWSLSLLNDSTMTAFAFELRNNKFEAGESVKFYHNDILQHTFDLSMLAPDTSSNDFIGFTTDFAFDRIDFDEGAVGDNIGIADLRFAAVAPEPVSYVLFMVGAGTLGFRRLWKR
jgi:hypothetical protein